MILEMTLEDLKKARAAMSQSATPSRTGKFNIKEHQLVEKPLIIQDTILLPDDGSIYRLIFLSGIDESALNVAFSYAKQKVMNSVENIVVKHTKN